MELERGCSSSRNFEVLKRLKKIEKFEIILKFEGSKDFFFFVYTRKVETLEDWKMERSM